MPPQELPRHVTFDELFADELDANSFTTAVKMTTFMLMPYRHIRLNYIPEINIYPLTFLYIRIMAKIYYNRDEPAIRSLIMLRPFFIENIMNKFHTEYEGFSAQGDLNHALTWTCTFPTNMCRYIYIHRHPIWYAQETVKVLAFFIGGQRFRRDGNFAHFEEEMRNYWGDRTEKVLSDMEPFFS